MNPQKSPRSLWGAPRRFGHRLSQQDTLLDGQKRYILHVARELIGACFMCKYARSAVFAVVFGISLLIFPMHLRADRSNRQADAIQTSRGELRITPIYHGSVMLEFGGKVIHV